MSKLASLIISVYIAAFLFANLFFIKQLTLVEDAGQLFWNHLAIFLILLVPVFLLVSKYISRPYTRSGMRTMRTVILAIAFLGLSMSVLYHIIPLEPIYNLPSQVDMIFASDLAFSIWLILPLLVLFI
jgi:hypothetical protein